MDPENVPYTMDTTSDAEAVPAEPTPQPRRRRKKSFVWDYFTVEAVGGGSTKAICNQCKQTYSYSTGSKIAGTSHLKRHILMGICPKLRQDKKQAPNSGSKAEASTDPPKRRYRTNASLYAFDQEQCCADLAKMIIMHDYPLHMVEHPSFNSFVQALQPRFKMPDFGNIENEIMVVHQKEKHSLAMLLDTIPGRVSLTIGLWTTNQTLGYVGLTGHFIDSSWKLHKRLLNFMMVSSPHSENALSDVIGYSLSDWNMKTKLFTITLDNNCSSHDIYSANLRDHLTHKNTLMLKGQLFVVRCYAHILNLIAQDLIASIHGIVYNIRESVKYIKASLAREEKFVEIAQQLQAPTDRALSLDVQLQWNTTYLMLLAALDFRHVFSYLESCDPSYNEAPSNDDWRKVEIVCAYLKLLFDSVNVITGSASPTSNIYFHEAWKIELELKNASLNDDPLVSGIAKDMYEKFDKYWKDSSLILAIAVVMDPRFKMKLVEFSFTKIYGQDAPRYIKVVDDAIHDLYHEYLSQPLPLTPAYTEQPEGFNNVYTGNIEVTTAPEAIKIDVSEPAKIEGNPETTLDMAIVEVNNIGSNNADANNAGKDYSEAANGAVTEDKADMQAENVEGDESKAIVEANNAEATGTPNSGVSESQAIVEVNNPEAISVEMKDAHAHTLEYTRVLPAVSTGDDLLDFDIYISENAVNNQTKSELDQYLEESLVPRIQEFDILNWWKLNILKYPTLSKMSRDVLSIPMSMVSSFTAGSGSRMLDDYRSSLRPEIVEALFCTKDWLQQAPTPLESPPTVVKMEF